MLPNRINNKRSSAAISSPPVDNKRNKADEAVSDAMAIETMPVVASTALLEDEKSELADLYWFTTWAELEEKIATARATQLDNAKPVTANIKQALFTAEPAFWISFISQGKRHDIYVAFEEDSESQFFLLSHNPDHEAFLKVGCHHETGFFAESVIYNQHHNYSLLHQDLKTLRVRDVDNLSTKFQTLFFSTNIQTQLTPLMSSTSSSSSSSASAVSTSQPGPLKLIGSTSFSIPMSLFKRSAANEEKIHGMEYIQFQSIVIYLSSKPLILADKNRLIHTLKSIFLPSADVLAVNWYNQKKIFIRFEANENRITVADSAHSKAFLSASVLNKEDQKYLHTEIANNESLAWSEAEINDVAAHLIESLRTGINSNHESSAIQTNIQQFFQRTQDFLTQPYFTRVSHVLFNGMPCGSLQEHIVHWPDTDYPHRSLVMRFGATEYSSYFLSEKELFRLHYNNACETGSVSYYALNVFECTDGNLASMDYRPKDDDDNDNPLHLLNIITTLDSLVGELHQVRKGPTFSGKQVLDLGLYLLDNLLKVGSVYLSDLSAIQIPKTKEEKTGFIPLRVSLSIGGDTPHTWYSKQGFNPLTFDNILTGWDNKNRLIVSQDADKYVEAIMTLRQLKLSELHRILPPTRQDYLKNLFTTYQSHFSSADKDEKSNHEATSVFGETTLHELIALVYGVSKKIKPSAKHVEELNEMLDLNHHFRDLIAFDEPRKSKYGVTRYMSATGVVTNKFPDASAVSSQLETNETTRLDSMIRTVYFTRFFGRSLPRPVSVSANSATRVTEVPSSPRGVVA
jgi:hypothetical protein